MPSYGGGNVAGKALASPHINHLLYLDGVRRGGEVMGEASIMISPAPTAAYGLGLSISTVTPMSIYLLRRL